ncbi:MAG: hypothetical protein IT379_27190 [Deltaproteobacteria bacterium]|nr:hypothetical protein [Deltaproteobacteria bacterium]
MSGYVRHDYVLTFQVRDDARRAELAAKCDGPWQGDAVTDTTWEVSTDLSPADFEAEIASFLSPGDRAAYYYLVAPASAGATATKRLFRVDVDGEE